MSYLNPNPRYVRSRADIVSEMVEQHLNRIGGGHLLRPYMSRIVNHILNRSLSAQKDEPLQKEATSFGAEPVQSEAQTHQHQFANEREREEYDRFIRIATQTFFARRSGLSSSDMLAGAPMLIDDTMSEEDRIFRLGR